MVQCRARPHANRARPHGALEAACTTIAAPRVQRRMDADSAEDDDSPGLHSGLVFVGILLACMGACTSGFGMNLMKASSRLEAHRPLHKRYRWILGASLACYVNTSLDIVAFALAPLSLIAPIGGLTIVVSVLVARLGIVDGVKETVSLK